MKKYVNKLLLMLITTVILTGCGKEDISYGEEKPSVIKTKLESEAVKPDTLQETISWADQHIPLSSPLENAVVKDGIVYGYYQTDEGLTVVSQDIQENKVLQEAVLPNMDYGQSIAVDTQGNVYVLGISGEESVFWKMAKDGQTTALEDFEIEDVDTAYFVSPQGLFVDEQGYFYIWYEMDLPLKDFDPEAEEDVYTVADRIYVKDTQGKTLFYEQVQDSQGIHLLGFCFQEEGVPILLVQDNDGTYMQELSAENKASKVRIDEMDIGMEAQNIAATEGGFLFCQGSSLYQYSLEIQSSQKVLDLASYGIFPDNVIYLGTKEDSIEIVDNYAEGKNAEYTLLEKGENSKTRLTLGTIQAFQDLEKAVTEFNRFHSDIQIEMITYYDGEGEFDAALEQLKLDIIRGEAPDILETSMIDVDMLAGKDMWVDLYEYMEQDEECKKEMLIPNVLEAYEVGNHLYSIAPGFQIFSMWGGGSVVQDRYGVTLHQLIELLAEHEKDLNAIYGFSADEPALTILCTMGMDEFIDWENRTCDFEGEAFLEALEFAKEYRGTNIGSISSAIQQEEILLTMGIISSVADYQMENKLYGEAVDFIGYPTAETSGTAVGFRGSQLAINKKSSNPDKAWSFIKYYLLNGSEEGGFPVVKEQFEEKLLQDMEKYYESTTEGTFEMPRKAFFDGDVHLYVYEASPEDVAAVKELVKRAEGKFHYHVEIQKIINEEAASYLAGQKSAKEVAALIQNRVSLYLKE